MNHPLFQLDPRTAEQRLADQKQRVAAFEEALGHLVIARIALGEVYLVDVESPRLQSAREAIALTIDHIELELKRSRG